MEFGPEIKVDGKRPEWWTGPGPAQYRHTSERWQVYTGHREWSELDWKYANYIRLSADHPHYNLITHTYTVRPEDEAALLASDPLSRSTPTPDERVVAPELVERMRAFVQKCHDLTDYEKINTSMPFVGLAVTDEERFLCTEARAILAALEPVDEDLVVAREIAHERLMALGASSEMIAADDIAKGLRDDAIVVHVARAALARGRQLEKEGK